MKRDSAGKRFGRLAKKVRGRAAEHKKARGGLCSVCKNTKQREYTRQSVHLVKDDHSTQRTQFKARVLQAGEVCGVFEVIPRHRLSLVLSRDGPWKQRRMESGRQNDFTIYVWRILLLNVLFVVVFFGFCVFLTDFLHFRGNVRRFSPLVRSAARVP